MNTSSTINEQITTHFAGEHRPEVFKRLASNEKLLESIWGKYQSVMTEGEVDLQTKELIGLSVAIAKPSEYVIGLQQRRVRRVGVNEEAEQEALTVAAHFEAFGAFAHALHVETDSPFKRSVVDGSRVDPELDCIVAYVVEPPDECVARIYDEIRDKMELTFVPNIFQAMAHQPAMLQAKWDCYKATMLEGVLSRLTKELIALAVSSVNGCFYCADTVSASCRQQGLSDRGLVEAACVIDLFAGICTLAKGFRLGKRNF